MTKNKTFIVNDYKKKINKRARYALVAELMNRRPMTRQAFQTIDLCLFVGFLFVNRYLRSY